MVDFSLPTAIATKAFPSIPQPKPEMQSMHSAMLALKEAVEVMTNQRGSAGSSVVTWDHLVSLGLIDQSQIPK